MMNRRERVLAALHFEKTDFTPYQIGFTGQMYNLGRDQHPARPSRENAG